MSVNEQQQKPQGVSGMTSESLVVSFFIQFPIEADQFSWASLAGECGPQSNAKQVNIQSGLASGKQLCQSFTCNCGRHLWLQLPWAKWTNVHLDDAFLWFSVGIFITANDFPSALCRAFWMQTLRQQPPFTPFTSSRKAPRPPNISNPATGLGFSPKKEPQLSSLASAPRLLWWCQHSSTFKY